MWDLYLLPLACNLSRACKAFSHVWFVTQHPMIFLFVSGPKSSRSSVVTVGQREAWRFKLNAARVWFSISTCQRRRAAGHTLSVTPDRWAPASWTTGDGCGSSAGVNVLCKHGGEREWICHKSCGVAVSFPSADLGEVAGWEAWVARGEKKKNCMIYRQVEQGAVWIKAASD